MRTRAAIMALSFSITPVLANQAVEEANYSIGVDSTRFTGGGDSSASSFGVRGSATLPLADFLGADLSAYSGRNTGSIEDTDCDLSLTDLSGQLFARHPQRGSIGAGYGQSQAGICSSVSGEEEFDIERSSISSELYLSSITIGASRTRVTDDFADNTLASTFLVGWYPRNSAFLSLSASGIDQEKDEAWLLAQWQPWFFNGGELEISYGNDYQYQSRSWTIGVRHRDIAVTTRYSTDEQDNRNWGLTISYFFEKHADLLTRHRYH